MEGLAAIGLVNPKSPLNVGGALRAAACYGAALVVIEGSRGHGSLTKLAQDTSRAWRAIPTLCAADLFASHPVGTVPIGIDLVPGAVSLVGFVHPARAFYVFGPEDGTLGRKHLDRCAAVVCVPTALCMNLAATVNVVLYDRMAKEGR